MPESAQPQVVVSGNGGNKLAKIAPIILGFVILIVLSEFAFLWYSKKARPKLEESGIKEIPIVNNFVAETPPPEIIGGTLYPEKAFAFADTLQNIKDLGKEEFVRSAGVNFSVKGNVLEVILDVREVDGISYSHKIKIENSTKNKALSFWFTDQEIETARIVFVTGDKAGQKLNFEDIKPGYFVSMQVAFDLLDSTPDSRLFLEVSSFGQ